MDRPTVPECLDEAVMLLRAGCGCGLHIVLDDGNVKDEHVRLCLETEPWPGKPDHRPLARKMLLMTKTQRSKLGMLAGRIAYGPPQPTIQIRWNKTTGTT